jgi:hypothetical protein
VDRAEDHRRCLAEIWNAHLEDHPFDFELVHEGEGVHILRVWEERPLPAEFAVRLGEWLYNIRSCLDHIVWATAAYTTGTVPPTDEAKLQYPVYASKAAWERNAYRLKHLADHHREMLWTMQPFNGDADANYLGAVNNLARIDRHRRPNIGTAYLAELEPVVQVPEGSRVTLEFGQRVLSGGKADAIRLVVDPWEDGMQVKINPRVGIDPEIGEWARSPFWRRIRFSERLTMIQVFVAAETAVYEYDCTGQTRKPQALTSAFKAECDGRERNGPPTETVEPWTWGPPEAGSPSSEDRFLGHDFPEHGPGPASRPTSASDMR